jgi:hypothetical protein
MMDGEEERGKKQENGRGGFITEPGIRNEIVLGRSEYILFS